MRTITARAENEWAVTAADLEEAIRKDVAEGLVPFFVCATIGTTSSCAVDPIPDIAKVASSHKAWCHVDAAYAGSAGILPEMSHHFEGLQNVDSYNFNPHKWLLTNFDCCAMWVADQAAVRQALSLTPIFLEVSRATLVASFKLFQPFFCII